MAKVYRCCRCNKELGPNEPYFTRERTVTHQRFNSGRDYKVKAFPRYHTDERICQAIRLGSDFMKDDPRL